MKVGVSFLKYKNSVEETINDIDKSNADYIHVDIMDGVFVPEANYTVSDIKKLTKNCNKKLDVHMMMCSPNKYIKDFAKFKNIEYLTIHYEAHRRPIDVINMIRHTNMKVGLAISPDTKVHKIIPMLNHVDQVLVMSVKPGKGGQKFIEDVLYKVETLKQVREENNYHYIISIDGGINNETAKLAKEAGCDMVVSGSYVISQDDMNSAIDSLR
ncbi:MAG: ribulose-phosphate 3-epimerase [Candidatus Coprovivens sp.]